MFTVGCATSGSHKNNLYRMYFYIDILHLYCFNDEFLNVITNFTEYLHWPLIKLPSMLKLQQHYNYTVRLSAWIILCFRLWKLIKFQVNQFIKELITSMNITNTGISSFVMKLVLLDVTYFMKPSGILTNLLINYIVENAGLK